MSRPFAVRKWLRPAIAEAYRLIQHITTKLPVDHQARANVGLALHWLRVTLEQSAAYTYTAWRPWQDTDVKIGRHLAQLRRHGVEPEQLLALVAGFMWARDVFAMMSEPDYLKHQLGHYALNFVSIPHPDRPEPEQIGAKAAKQFGQLLLDRVGHIASLLTAQETMARLLSFELPEKLQRPVPKTVSARANRRPRYRPPAYDDDD
jgi:hypothetical protein